MSSDGGILFLGSRLYNERGNSVAVENEVLERHHHGIMNSAKVGEVLHFFSENINGIDDAGDVKNASNFVVDNLTNFVLA